MSEVAEINRSITKDSIKITISVFLKSGIVQREYAGKLSYSRRKQLGLPYVLYRAVFFLEGKEVKVSGSSPERILHRAFMAVSKDARGFASEVLKKASRRSRLNWPIYGFLGEKCLVSSW